MPKLHLTISAPSLVEEKLLDVLMEFMSDPFDSASTFTHGTAHGRLSRSEQVIGRSAAVQAQVAIAEEQLEALLSRLREEFHGVGLRYWATPVVLEGEIE